MMLDMWPRQRANAKRKRLSQREREYRERVRKNKTRAAVKASNARISEERASRVNQREDNRQLIAANRAVQIEAARRRK